MAETELAEAVGGVHPLVSAQATQVQQESWQHIDSVLGNAVFPFGSSAIASYGFPQLPFSGEHYFSSFVFLVVPTPLQPTSILNFLCLKGAWVPQFIKHLPSTQVMILES